MTFNSFSKTSGFNEPAETALFSVPPAAAVVDRWSSGTAWWVLGVDVLLPFVLLQDYKPEEDPALFHSAKTDRGPLGPEWKVPDTVTQSRDALMFQHRDVHSLSDLAELSSSPVFSLWSFKERAEDRLSLHVCIQTGHGQVQMVGSADQSGELHPQGNDQYLLTTLPSQKTL